MAASLGSLVVSLGLNAAEFTAGMTKAEYQSQQAMRRMKENFEAIGKAVGIASVAVAAFAVKMGADFIEAASALDDMAEKTGASVEELSKLSQQAFISGQSLESVETGLIQLSKHLHGSGEESKNTTRALAALGLKAEELKNLDTAEAFRIIAVEMNKFADGGGKAALMLDLAGKSGAQLLPIMKDLAQDGALAAKVTAEQAAAAEALGKEWRRLVLEAKNVGQAIALDIVPYLRNLIEQFREGQKIAGSFWAGLSLNMSVFTGGDTAAQVTKITKEIDELQKKLANPPARGGSPMWRESLEKDIAQAQKRLEYAKVIMRQSEDARLKGMGGDEAPERPLGVLKYEDPKKATAAAGIDKAAAAADKYRQMLLGLESQLRSVNGEETELQKVREKMAADKDFQSIPVKQQEQLRSVIELTAQQIDQAKDQKRALDLTNKGWVEHAEAAKSAYEAELTAAGSLVKTNAQLTDMATALKLTLDPLHEFKGKWDDINDLVAQGKITELQGQLLKLPAHIRELIVPAENAAQQLQRLWEAGLVTNEQMEVAFGRLNDNMDKAETGAKDFSHAIGTAFEDAILKGEKFGDVIKGLGEDIARIALRMTVTKPLESALEGAIGQGLPALLRGVGGGAAAAASTQAPVNVASLGGTQFGSDFSVLQSFATGTDYVPRTGLYQLHQGEAVIPAGKNGGGITINAPMSVDARGATQEAIPGIVAALNAHERALQRLVTHDAYKRDGATRQALNR